MTARLMLGETHVQYWVALGDDPYAWDASLREEVQADGAQRVRAQFFIAGGSACETFATRAEALAWMQEQYDAAHPKAEVPA